MQTFPMSSFQKQLWRKSAFRFNYGVWCYRKWNICPTEEEFRSALVDVAKQIEILRTTIQSDQTDDRALQKEGLQKVLQEPIIKRLNLGISNLRDKGLANQLVQEKTIEDENAICYEIFKTDSGSEVLIWLNAFYCDKTTLEELMRRTYGRCMNADLASKELAIIQYGDFSEWQSQLEPHEEGLMYWGAVNESINDYCIPFYHEVNRTQNEGYAWLESESFSPDLEKFKADDVESLMLAAWLSFMHMLNQQDRMSIYVRKDLREIEDITDCLGPLVAFYPINVDCSKCENDFSTLTVQIQKLIAESMEWSNEFHAFNSLAKDENAKYKLGYSYYKENTAAVPNSEVYEVISDSMIHLEVYARNIDQGFISKIRYSRRLYKEKQIHRLINLWAHYVKCLFGHGQVELKTFRSHINQILKERSIFQGGKSIISLNTVYERVCLVNQEKIAIETESESISYGDLLSKVKQYAGYMRVLGVAKDGIVALALPKSIDHIAFALAAHFIRAAYVPINTNDPVSRIKHIIEECQCHVIITNQDGACKLDEIDLDCELIIIERDIDDIFNHPVQLTFEAHRDSDRAYVIYTSGSSGKPKGVCISQGNIVNYAVSVIERINAKENAKITWISTIFADLSYTAIYGALCTGRTLFIAPEECTYEIEKLSQLVDQHHIDIIKLVPTHLKALLEYRLKEPNLPKTIVMGGEALDSGLVSTIKSINPTINIYNHYGPTECTVGALCGPVSTVFEIDLGSPLAGYTAYVLDENQNEIIAGQVGELYISGAGICMGYLGRAIETKSVFLLNPYSAFSGDKLIYKTGDKVYLTTDRKIRYLSRVDDQVKINGYRVEVKEIESAIRNIEGIKDAVIVLEKNNLHAYYTCCEAQHISELQVRNTLSDSLPEYMLPNKVCKITTIPYTVNGKLDKKKLIKAEPLVKNKAGAKNGLVKKLISVWQAHFTGKEIDETSNFYELGGDSILAIQISAKAKKLGIDLPASQVFELQTIDEIAKNITDKPENTGQAISTGFIEYSGYQAVLKKRLGEAWRSTLSTRVLEVDKQADVEVIKNTILKLVENYYILRTRLVNLSSGDSVQYIDDLPAAIEDYFKEIESENFSKNDVYRLVSEFSTRCENESCALANFYFIKSTTNHTEKNHLVIAINQLIIDGYSWRLLLIDLMNSIEDVSQSSQTGSKSLEINHNEKKSPPSGGDLHDMTFNYTDESAYDSSTYLDNTHSNNYVSIDISFCDFDSGSSSSKNTTDIEDQVLKAITLVLTQEDNTLELKIDIEKNSRNEKLGRGRETDFGYYVKVAKTKFVVTENTNDSVTEVENIEYSADNFTCEKISFSDLGRYAGQESSNKIIRMSDILIQNISAKEQKSTYQYEFSIGIVGNRILLNLKYDKKIVERKNAEKLLTKIHQILSSGYNEYSPIVDEKHSAHTENKCLPDVEDKSFVLPERYWGMFLFQRKHGLQHTYKIQSVYEYKGLLNIDSLISAWKDTYWQYDALRLRLANNENGRLTAKISDNDLLCRCNSVTVYRICDREPIYKKLLESCIEKISGEVDTPLIDVLIVEREENHYHIVWTHHHLISDGWSSKIVWQSVFEKYADKLNNVASSSPNAPSITIYYDWLKQVTKNCQVSSDDTYDYCGKLPEKLLSTDSSINKYFVYRKSISDELCDHIIKAAAHEKVSPNTIFQAAWVHLMCQLKCTNKLAYDLVCSGRQIDITSIENIVGMFSHAATNNVDIGSARDDVSLLQRIQQQSISLEESLYEVLSCSTNSEAAIETLLVFEQSSVGKKLQRLDVKRVEGYSFSHYPLSLVIHSLDQQLFELKYNAGFINQDIVEWLCEYYVGFIEKIVYPITEALVNANNNDEDSLSAKKIISAVLNNSDADWKANCKLNKYINFQKLGSERNENPGNIRGLFEKLGQDENRTKSGNRSIKIIENNVKDKRNDVISNAEDTHSLQLMKDIIDIWQSVLTCQHINDDDDFFALGGDSISAIQIANKMCSLNFNISALDIMEQRTIKKIVSGQKNHDARKNEALSDNILRLSDIQQLFLRMKKEYRDQYIQYRVLRVKNASLGEILHDLKSLWLYRDMLRLRLVDDSINNNSVGIVKCEPTDEAFHEICDIHHTKKLDECVKFDNTINELSQSIDLQHVLFRMRVLLVGDEKYIILVGHHFILDTVSWKDLVDTLNQSNETTMESDISRFNMFQNEKCATCQKIEMYDYWEAYTKKALQVESRKNIFNIIQTEKAEINRKYITHTFEIDLKSVTEDFNSGGMSRYENIVLASLMKALVSGSDDLNFSEGTVFLDLETNGRNAYSSKALPSGIGWYTDKYLFMSDVGSAQSIVHIYNEITDTKEKMQKQIPAYQAYLLKQFDEGTCHFPLAKIKYNFHGQYLKTQNKKYNNVIYRSENSTHAGLVMPYALTVDAVIVGESAEKVVVSLVYLESLAGTITKLEACLKEQVCLLHDELRNRNVDKTANALDVSNAELDSILEELEELL